MPPETPLLILRKHVRFHVTENCKLLTACGFQSMTLRDIGQKILDRQKFLLAYCLKIQMSLGARGLPAFPSQITASDVLEVFEAEIDRRSARKADAIALAIPGEWQGRVMTLRMIAAEDEIDELLEHALGS